MKPQQRHMLRQPIVLILNRAWQAVNDRNPIQVFKMLSKGVVTALDIATDGTPTPCTWEQWIQLPVREGDRFIRTARGLIRVPLVVVLGRYSKLPPAPARVPFTVDAVWERDQDTCQYCGKKLNRRDKEGNLDHVIPRRHGGKTVFENIVLSCLEDNTRKADRTPEQAGMRLLRKPKSPARISPALRLKNRYNIAEWTHFGVN
jgi:5-methylcytosine-specific restriction endonuclease McrA